MHRFAFGSYRPGILERGLVLFNRYVHVLRLFHLAPLRLLDIQMPLTAEVRASVSAQQNMNHEQADYDPRAHTAAALSFQTAFKAPKFRLCPLSTPEGPGSKRL